MEQPSERRHERQGQPAAKNERCGLKTFSCCRKRMCIAKTIWSRARSSFRFCCRQRRQGRVRSTSSKEKKIHSTGRLPMSPFGSNCAKPESTKKSRSFSARLRPCRTAPGSRCRWRTRLRRDGQSRWPRSACWRRSAHKERVRASYLRDAGSTRHPCRSRPRLS